MELLYAFSSQPKTIHCKAIISIIIIYFLDKNRFDVDAPYVCVIMRGI